MYFAVLNNTGWDWIFCFLFTACAVVRLARFNVEQAGRAKTHFTGLPSPAAGMTLATYYWFSQTPLYTETMIGGLPWHQMLRWVMLGLGVLMISNVQYAAVPTVGLRTWRGLAGLLLVIGTLVGVIFLPKQFFFPALMCYVLYGIGRTVLLGLLDRLPAHTDDDADEGVALVADGVAVEADLPLRRQRKRRRDSRSETGRTDDREDSST